MAANTYDIGQLTRISALFTNAALTPTDPGTVTLKILLPSGTTTTLVYGTDPIVKDSTGNYHYDFSITLAADHWYKWSGTTPIQAVAESYFKVRAQRIP